MSEPFQELLDGEQIHRFAPGERHEQICERLETWLSQIIGPLSAARILPRRSEFRLSSNTRIHPDIALVTKAGNKLILAIEVISSQDHRPDTVSKKIIYEDYKVPRLWMVDPRYNNVEVYHGTAFGMALKEILAGSQKLSDTLLPGLEIEIKELFAD